MKADDRASWLAAREAEAERYQAEQSERSRLVDPAAAGRAVAFARELNERDEKAWRAALARAADSPHSVTRDHSAAPVAPVDPAKIAEMTWYDDRGYYCGPEIGAEMSAEDRAFAFSAEGEYVALCKEGTGATLDSAAAEKFSRQAHTLAVMTKQIAEKMIAAGFNPYRETGWITERYFVHSRERETIPPYRRITFLPAMAQALRAPRVAALEFWLSKHPFARFWTFSSGTRVQLADVAERVRFLHAKLNDLNAQPFMRAAGVRLVLRSTELGEPEREGKIERDEAGAITFHVHAHVVVELAAGFIPPEKWAKLLSKVGGFWPAWWGEGKIIRSAKECCKYVTKPGELLKLSGAELVALRGQLAGLHLVQPLGTLREEIRDRDAKDLRLVKKRTHDGKVYFAVKDWNRHARRTESEKDQAAAGKLVPVEARGAVRIVSRGVPRFGKSGIAEPTVVVMFLRGSWNEDTVRDHALVAPVIRVTAELYADALAERAAVDHFWALSAGDPNHVRIRVHTRTATVCRPGAPPSVETRSERQTAAIV